MFVVVDGDVKTVECGVWSVRREMIVSGVSLIFQGCACDVCVYMCVGDNEFRVYKQELFILTRRPISLSFSSSVDFAMATEMRLVFRSTPTQR